MTKLATLLLTLGVLSVLLPVSLKLVDNYGASFSSEELVEKPAPPAIPGIPDLLKDIPVKSTPPLVRSLILETKNTAVLRGPVTGESVGKLMKDIAKISRDVSKTASIYLVLDTPGGSVPDGADFIDFLNALPQKVTTVTLFAASMGFQIVENNPGERLIVRNGMLMSHRAALSGLSGQFDGELESRYHMMKRQVDMLENADAARMGLTLVEYKAKVKDELWIHGFDSVSEKVADAEVLVRCGSSYEGQTTELSLNTMFGLITVVFDACPLIKSPIAVRMENIPANAKNYVNAIVYDAFLNKEKFVKEWILTDKFHKVFP